MSPLLMAALATLGIPAGLTLLFGVLPMLRRTGKPAAILSILGATSVLGIAGWLFATWLGNPTEVIQQSTAWLVQAGRPLGEVGVRLDGISVSMLLVVAVVAWCVQVFSLGYLSDEPPNGLGRYFTYQSLFLFSMNLLVLAPDLMQLFIGWELVGATSYLLIGFWYPKPAAAKAAIKAFVVTKFADSGLILGLLVLAAQTGSFAWDAPLGTGVAEVVAGLLFVAVMGKSAQFPLHIWLPDAMQGPTPVSALLHAATMVAAGVYLIVRADPIFAAATHVREFMTQLGAFTALFAAIVATVQTDIKKVLAYSTCSQLGYMISGLGAGSLLGGYFHLTTHAFFKALLFLAAGAVIHAVHSNEFEDMGGLWKKLKFVAIAFVFGSLSLAGVPGLAGFYSKDLILEAVHESGDHFALAALLLTAGLTAFYMTRAVVKTFLGQMSHAAEHAHGPGPSMSLPLLVLLVPTIALGWAAQPFATLFGKPYEFHMGTVGYAAIGLGLGGIALGYLVYGVGALGFLPRLFAPLGKLARSSLMDELWQSVYEIGGQTPSRAAAWIDRYVVDGLMNFLGWLTIVAGQQLRKLQTGDVQDYLYAVFGAAALLALFGGWR
ncbi:MAG: NADH-quinone oxidoreductase subunit L [Deltaproteobacteria bacterium]|nr:NADH-quinone oxidoreductase subunit L [Deltaproteobacteria bacterium]